VNQLVAYYDETPVDANGKVEIQQSPISSTSGLRAAEGLVRTHLVYVAVPSEAGSFLVPFSASTTTGPCVTGTTRRSGS
jgi:hypothetical protein